MRADRGMQLRWRGQVRADGGCSSGRGWLTGGINSDILGDPRRQMECCCREKNVHKELNATDVQNAPRGEQLTIIIYVKTECPK